MTVKIKPRSLFQYFLIYWLLLDAGAAAVSVIGTNTYYISLLALGVGTCFVMRNTRQFKGRFKYQFQIFCLILMLLYAATFLMSFGGLYYTIILSHIGRISIVLAAITIEPDQFTARFIKTVSILAMVSLIIFVGYFAFGTDFWSFITSRLPVARTETSSLGAQYGIFFLCFNYFDSSRNSYIFGEPGEYQLVVSAAIFLLLFVKSELTIKEKKGYLLILLVTMVTIQSTTGYISLVVLLACALLNHDKSAQEDVKIIKKFLIGITIFAVVGVLFFDGWDYFINKVVTEKVMSDTGSVDFNQGTASARWNGFLRLVEYIDQHPLSCVFGIGFVGRTATNVTSCNGFANSVLDYGVLTIGWLIYNYCKSLIKYTNIPGTIAGLFIIMNTWFGQPVPLYTIVIVIAFTPMLIAKQPFGYMREGV